MANQNKKQKREETEIQKGSRSGAGLFIPAGILLGMGIGFAVNNVPAGMFIGLGIGFAAFAIALLIKNK